ncbi:hypothetical protein TPCG7_12340 [Cutibacterium granulosum]|nr:hypothetical protein TPCG7_12340 [Cutibacterium granulosum]
MLQGMDLKSQARKILVSEFLKNLLSWDQSAESMTMDSVWLPVEKHFITLYCTFASMMQQMLKYVNLLNG